MGPAPALRPADPGREPDESPADPGRNGGLLEVELVSSESKD